MLFIKGIYLLLSHLPTSHTTRTCRSAYGGFVLLHLTVCGKLFSTIPLSNVTSDEEVRRVAFIYYCTARFDHSL